MFSIRQKREISDAVQAPSENPWNESQDSGGGGGD